MRASTSIPRTKRPNGSPVAAWLALTAVVFVVRSFVSVLA